MTALVSYSTGTATVAAGGTTVTGIGTIWSGVNARPGDIFQIGNYQSVISDVVDTDELTIPPWGGGAQTAVAYKIWQVSPQRFAGAQAMADVSTLVAALNTDGFFFFVDTTETVPDPSLGNDGQYASQPTTGKVWLKTGGAWSYLGIYKAFQPVGAWSGATAYAVGDVVTLSGSSYVCVLAHTNHAPPNTTYWQLLASIGGTGLTGATGAGYGGTSTTSLAIGTGSKVFTTQAGLAYTNGARVRASSAANTSNWMEGVVTYSGTTLTMTSSKTSGSGTFADWNLNVVGEPGAGDLTSANNLSDLASAVTSRKNLGLPAMARSYLAGLTLSTAGSSSTFAVAAGVAVDDSNTDFMSLAASISKNTSNWSLGAGAGSLDTGSNAANTWYHVFLIKRTDTGVVDVLMSLSATAPTMPTNYTLKRRIGSIKTDGSSQWTMFTQVGDEFHWAANNVELAGVAIASTAVNTITLAGVPPGVICHALFHGAINPGASSNGVLFYSLDENDIAVLGATGSRNASLWAPTSGAFQAGDFVKRTNTSAQIRWKAFAASGDIGMYVFGWIDRRGRDA